MRPISRGLIGACIGALLVLVFYPTTRPYFNPGELHRVEPLLKRSVWIPENLKVAPDPVNAVAAAYYLGLAAQKLELQEQSNPVDLDRWARLAEQLTASDKTNAFWPQLLAVLRDAQGRPDQARWAWSLGSKRMRWDDYQEVRVNRVLEEIGSSTSPDLAWHNSVAFQTRLTAAPRLIRRYGARLVGTKPLSDPESLDIRYETVRNAQLLRDGSQTLEQFRIGALLMEVPARPVKVADSSSERQLLLGRFELINAMRAAGQVGRGAELEAAYQRNASWIALIGFAEASGDRKRLETAAYFSGTVGPSMVALCLFVSLAATLGWVLGVGRKITGQKLLGLAALNILAALILSHSWYVILATCACWGFFLVSKHARRSAQIGDLGLLFRVVLTVLSGGLILSGALLIMSRSDANLALSEVASWTFGNLTKPQPMLEISLVLIALTAFLCPSWSLISRFPTLRVFDYVSRKALENLLVSSLFAAVFVGLGAMVADRAISVRLSELGRNEPTYYYNRWAK